MRQARKNMKWLLGDRGILLGVQLGFDFLVEHECGINELIWSFGMDSSACGVERTRIRSLPENLSRTSIEETQTFECLFFYPRSSEHVKEYLQEWRSSIRYLGPSDDKLLCGWSRSDFGVFDFSPEGKLRIDELFEAFKALDICIEYSSRDKGLSLKILSRISDEDKGQSFVRDLDVKALKRAAWDTGIEKVLQEAGLRWYGLTPQWADDRKEFVAFRLNPMDQHLYNDGVFSEKDLRLWTQGKGPIVKSP